MILFLANPSVYTLPGTWEKQPLIEAGLAIPILIGVVVIALMGYGIYMLSLIHISEPTRPY